MTTLSNLNIIGLLKEIRDLLREAVDLLETMTERSLP